MSGEGRGGACEAGFRVFLTHSPHLTSPHLTSPHLTSPHEVTHEATHSLTRSLTHEVTHATLTRSLTHQALGEVTLTDSLSTHPILAAEDLTSAKPKRIRRGARGRAGGGVGVEKCLFARGQRELKLKVQRATSFFRSSCSCHLL